MSARIADQQYVHKNKKKGDDNSNMNHATSHAWEAQSVKTWGCSSFDIGYREGYWTGYLWNRHISIKSTNIR